MDEQEHISVVEGDVAIVEKEIKTKRDLFLPISILIAAVVIGGSVVFATFYRPAVSGVAGAGGTAGAGNPSAINKANPSVDVVGPRDVVQGNMNAPITVVEYGDYQCPFCASFFSQVEPTLESQYINTGKVNFIFRDFAFLGPESIAAGEAAECALDQNAFWAYHDALYNAKIGDVQRGGSEDDGFFNATLFVQLAKNVGIDTTVFKACIASNKYAATIAAEANAGRAIGVNSTPTTFISGVEVTDASGSSVGADPNAIMNALTAAVAAK